MAEDRDAIETARELRAAIGLGMDCRAFLDSPLGRRILDDTDAETATLKTRAVEIDTDTAEGREEHRQLRQRIGVLYHWQSLFADYIKAGDDATAQYEQGEITGDEEPLDDS